MNNKLPFNSIYRVIGSIFFISSIFYIGYIFLFCENKVIKLLSAIYISICVLLLILFLLFLRRKIISIYKIFDRYVVDIVAYDGRCGVVLVQILFGLAVLGVDAEHAVALCGYP